jgi:hypothetical protein
VFVPENRLEEALMAAATDPSGRPDFYRELQRSELYVITDGPAPSRPTRTTLEEDASVRLVVARVDGVDHVQAFSSLTRLQEAAGDRALAYLALQATDLLPILAGAGLVLNSASDYGTVLSPSEIADLASGQPPRFGEQWVARRRTQVLVGLPAEVPTELVDPLAAFFRSRPEVRAAYLGIIQVPGRDEEPVLLVGLDVLGEPKSILEETGIVLDGVADELGLIDLTTVDGSGLEGFFREQALTIYERSVEAS